MISHRTSPTILPSFRCFATPNPKVGAYPFTTIDPNIGRGYALVPDPSPLLGLSLGGCGWQAALLGGLVPWSAP
jgi:hypothetical protein